MRKKRFFGIYYKHQNKDGYTIAAIVSENNEGDMVQIITNEKAYIVKDVTQVKASFAGISFDVHQEDLSLTGYISYSSLSKPKKDIMSYYRFLPIECKHKVYSMYHQLDGEIIVNNEKISFHNGDGYIEGDRGRSFPKEYLWLNATNKEASIVLAIATIPLGLLTIKGITSLITYQGKEYRFGTYNFAKAKKISKSHIIVKKGKYVLDIQIDDHEGHALKAPIKGDMTRLIHECPSVAIHYALKKKEDIVLDINHSYASFEYVFKD